jgi:putative DNA primase/helicase
LEENNKGDAKKHGVDLKLLDKAFFECQKFFSKTTNISNIIKWVNTYYTKSNIYEKFDSVNPYVIAFDNGVYDLKNKCFRNAKPEELVTLTTGYDYAPEIPKYRKQLMKVLNNIVDDPEELKYMLNTMSLTLLGLNPLEEFYIWIGTGSNGKGVLAKLINKTLGGYYDSIDIEYLIKSGNNGNSKQADPIIARKKGKRGVVSTESENNAKLREAKLKELSGGDEIQCRELWGSTFNYNPVFSLFIQTNHKPEIDGTDQGMKRRLRFVYFLNKFVDDPTKPNERKINRLLKETIDNDINIRISFFNILLEHYNEIEKTDYRFPIPKRIKNDTDNFFRENDPLQGFMDDCMIEEKGKQIPLKDIHQAYNEYADASALTKMSSIALKDKLSEKGIEFKRISQGRVMLHYTIKEKDREDDSSSPITPPTENLFKKQPKINKPPQKHHIIDSDSESESESGEEL